MFDLDDLEMTKLDVFIVVVIKLSMLLLLLTAFFYFENCSSPVEPTPPSQPEIHRACDYCHDYPIDRKLPDKEKEFE